MIRGTRKPVVAEVGTREEEAPRKRCPPSWARLIARVYQVDPLVCLRCGRRMSVVGRPKRRLALPPGDETWTTGRVWR